MMKPTALLLGLALALVSLPTTSAFKLPLGARLLARPSAASASANAMRVVSRGGWTGASSTKTVVATPATLLKASGAAASAEDSQVWIAPAFHNKLSVRLLAIVSGVALAMRQTGAALPLATAKAVHLLAFGTNLGSTLYTTFILGIVMIKHLPRQTFGKLQSKLFPIYFAWSAVALAVQLLTGSVMGLNPKAMQWLGASLAAALLNSLLLEPASTGVMFARYKLEKENKRDTEDYKKLAKKFGGLHGASSLVNLVVVVGGFVHAYYLSLLLA